MAGARDERPLLTRAAVQRCMPVGSIVNARRNCSRGTGGLSDGGSAQGARAAAGCTEREPARDPSRVRRGAVCAEAGPHSQEDVGTPALKMAKCICDLSVCSNGGGIISRRQDLKIDKPFYTHKHRCTHASSDVNKKGHQDPFQKGHQDPFQKGHQDEGGGGGGGGGGGTPAVCS